MATEIRGIDKHGKGAGRNITKRYLSGGINGATFAYNNTTAVVGNTTAYDRTSNKFYERALQAEERDNLYQPVDGSGNIATPVPGYDSVSRLLQYQRGTLASTGGYESAGGGSITAPVTLPNTDQSRNYNLDALGNWTSSVYTPEGGSQVADQRNHNKLNEITQRTVGTNPAVTFQYDGASGASNGNLKNDGTLIYSYDAFNRPIQVNRVSDGLIIATYLYDAMNRRVRKTILNGGLTGNIPNGTTDYIWNGWSRRAGISAGGALAGEQLQQVVEERDSSNAPIRQYVWGTYPGAAALTRPPASTGFWQQNAGLGNLNIDECIELTTFVALGSQNLEPGSYYLLQDLLFRAVALTNSTGAIVEAYDTDAYGNTLIFTGPGADGVWFTDDDVQSSYGVNEIIYCGYPDRSGFRGLDDASPLRRRSAAPLNQHDPEAELYYVRNRSYNAALGRWVQRDPIGYAGGINLYGYVGGWAVVSVDPLGLREHPGPQPPQWGPWQKIGMCPPGPVTYVRHGSLDLGYLVLPGGVNPNSALLDKILQAALSGLAKFSELGAAIKTLLNELTGAGEWGERWHGHAVLTQALVYQCKCVNGRPTLVPQSNKTTSSSPTWSDDGLVAPLTPSDFEQDQEFAELLKSIIKQFIR